MEESCAACGKVDVSLKSCKACKLVKYCGLDCQVAHRSKHRKICRQKARELFDKKLFEKPPRREDCPICYLPMPCNDNEITYMGCCGKYICSGCAHSLSRVVCPFCNTDAPHSWEEVHRRILVRIEKYNDPEAMKILGNDYNLGESGLPVDVEKAVELFQRASDLGSEAAHYFLGALYSNGRGVQMDKIKAVHHFQLAAMMGSACARYHLGLIEGLCGNAEHAVRHFMIAAKCGHDDSLKMVKQGFIKGDLTKEDYEKTLRGHTKSQDETKSEQRDRAKADRG